MSSIIELGSVTLLPIKEAAEFVPYSSDYVARIAREGKIVATQIDRQWFVDVVSLQNFYAQASIEESVRKRLLSSKRKRDFEVAAMYRTRLAAISEKHRQVGVAAVLHTAAILCFGLGAGAIFIFANNAVTPETLQSAAEVIGFRSAASVIVGAAAVKLETVRDPLETNVPVIEVIERMDMSGGVVLLPQTSSDAHVVTDFFSDPVTVEMTSTTTGRIRSAISQEEMSFVRVPSRTNIVSPASVGVPPEGSIWGIFQRKLRFWTHCFWSCYHTP